LHAFARGQLATGHVLGAGFFTTAGGGLFQLHAKVVHGGLQSGGIGQKFCRTAVELGLKHRHV
jgi:hypothetical protein